MLTANVAGPSNLIWYTVTDPASHTAAPGKRVPGRLAAASRRCWSNFW